MDFGELSHDSDFKSKFTNFHNSLLKVGEVIEAMCSQENYDKMTQEEKVQYDLFLSFSINSIFWVYLRTQGIEPTSHGIKNEIQRVREYMSRSTQIHDRMNIMPRIDQDAAKRFIRSGLWEPKQGEQPGNDPSSSSNPNKRKREED